MSPPARVTRTPPGSEPADFEQAFDAFFAAVRRARGRAAASTDAGELTLAQ
jgi:hypothetical protein